MTSIYVTGVGVYTSIPVCVVCGNVCVCTYVLHMCVCNVFMYVCNVLWTRHEKRRRLSGERTHARHYTRSKKTRETKDAVDGQHGTMDRNAIQRPIAEDERQKEVE